MPTFYRGQDFGWLFYPLEWTRVLIALNQEAAIGTFGVFDGVEHATVESALGVALPKSDGKVLVLALAAI